MSDYWSAFGIATLRLSDSRHRCAYVPGRTVCYSSSKDTLTCGTIVEAWPKLSPCEYLVETRTGERRWVAEADLVTAPRPSYGTAKPDETPHFDATN
jgi:hypothetical protein